MGQLQSILLGQWQSAEASPQLSSLTEVDAKSRVLPYDADRVLAYLAKYCANGNDCPDGQIKEPRGTDCTHFVAHALKTCDIKVTGIEAQCSAGLCIRVRELAAAFYNATKSFSNVKQIANYQDARRGDFCFLPKWYGRKDHVMVLSDTPKENGAAIFGHDTNRCGRDFVEFDVPECKFYRIENEPSRFFLADVELVENAPSVAGRVYVTIQVNCPKCGCFLASYSEYREKSNRIYVGAIVSITYEGSCYNKDRCGSGIFDWRGTVKNGRIIAIRD